MTARQKTTQLLRALLAQGHGQLIITVENHQLVGIEQKNSFPQDAESHASYNQRKEKTSWQFPLDHSF